VSLTFDLRLPPFPAQYGGGGGGGGGGVVVVVVVLLLHFYRHFRHNREGVYTNIKTCLYKDVFI